MTGRPSIKLFYDVVSPFSYLAFETLIKYREAWNVDLELCPTFLGGIMVAAKNQTPGAHPLKGAYMDTDLQRLAQQYKLNLTLPDNYPHNHNTLNTIRFLRQVKEKESPQVLEECSRRLFGQVFQTTILPATPEFLLALTPSILTRERFDALLAESQSAENKARVKDEAQALVKDDGCFGFPWIKVQKPDGQVQNWFGSDRMDNIAYWLGDGYKYEGPHPKGVTARSKL